MKKEKNQIDIASHIVRPDIESYMRTLASLTDDPVLLEMEAFAKQQNFPIVNRLVGVFLAMQAEMIQAKRVFEFGSGYGYSAYWFAKAVGAEGQVTCSDSNPNNRVAAEKYLASTGLWQRLNFQVGMAQDVFLSTEGMFDICYNDVDKEAYPEIWQMAKDRIRPGGLYIADNVLWSGHVTAQNDSSAISGSTKAIIKHNQMIFNDAAFDAFINPTRDGVLVARKK
ncbi:predicted O-methyltransferase YrrM [Nitrosomonas sp. PY1]|uniref:O-methyltransferase n=1 Tax=Nitrosomonas sp. PY1 TaxID=1803906 RepID=UPI001FC86857|nr:O-methyltransferase [Nitrosomonas sp. PY1]GKS68429.1 predicted O-methyltransferase YrrM [Nitrosomonas sp. PY1]